MSNEIRVGVKLIDPKTLETVLGPLFVKRSDGKSLDAIVPEVDGFIDLNRAGREEIGGIEHEVNNRRGLVDGLTEPNTQIHHPVKGEIKIITEGNLSEGALPRQGNIFELRRAVKATIPH